MGAFPYLRPLRERRPCHGLTVPVSGRRATTIPLFRQLLHDGFDFCELGVTLGLRALGECLLHAASDVGLEDVGVDAPDEGLRCHELR